MPVIVLFYLILYFLYYLFNEYFYFCVICSLFMLEQNQFKPAI